MYKLTPRQAKRYFYLFPYTLHPHIHLHGSIKTFIRYIKYKCQLNVPTCTTGLDEHHSPQLTYALLIWLYCCSFFSGQSLRLYRQNTKGKVHPWPMLNPLTLRHLSVMHWAGNVTVHRRHPSSCPSKRLLLCRAIFRLIHRKWNYIC